LINKIVLDENEYYNLVNLNCELYKPVNTFSNLEQVIKIQKKKKLFGIRWPLPILLDSKKPECQIKKNCKYDLFYKKKRLGYIKCQNIFFIKNFKKYNNHFLVTTKDKNYRL